MATAVSLKDLARRFILLPAKFEAAVNHELKKVGFKAADTAKKKFGKYQPPIGPYPGWKALTAATVARKQKAGGMGDDPLIGHYSGKAWARRKKIWGAALRASIEFSVKDMNVWIGSKNPLAPHHEYGAPKKNIPPRPFLRPAMIETENYAFERMEIAWAEAVKLM